MQKTKIKRALISVFDKTGLVDFAQGLRASDIELVSTGNTAKTLRDAGIEVQEVQDLTGFPEMLGGRVKTLHPKIHGGILARRDKEDHMTMLRQHDIEAIDLVAINLYPFDKALEEERPHDAMIEMIDIGGPAMLRSAAKNYDSVTVICDPGDYGKVLSEITEGQGGVSARLRQSLASKVFTHTGQYDTLISGYFATRSNGSTPAEGDNTALEMSFSKVRDLRYGENPHQKAALYVTKNAEERGLSDAQILWGKELSFNNYLDLDAAWSIISHFDETAACVVKHNNPCGFAIDEDLSLAFKKAFAGDPLSAFGGIVGVNQAVDEKVAQTILNSGFLECVIAPAFSDEAMAVFKTKKNLRIVQMPRRTFSTKKDYKKITGALLLQDVNTRVASMDEIKVVTQAKPSDEQLRDLLIGFRLLPFIKSNGIAIMQAGQAVGLGMGQPSRVDSVKTALYKAGERAKGAVLASDGFFPKPDSIEFLAEQGIVSVIQPGGSIQDKAVIEACDKTGVSMVMTGLRHFSH